MFGIFSRIGIVAIFAVAAFVVHTLNHADENVQREQRYHNQYRYSDRSDPPGPSNSRSRREEPRSSSRREEPRPSSSNYNSSRTEQRETYNSRRGSSSSSNSRATNGSGNSSRRDDMRKRYFNEECPICTDPINDHYYIILDCDHRMHSHCALRLARLVSAPKCPICRKPIKLED